MRKIFPVIVLVCLITQLTYSQEKLVEENLTLGKISRIISEANEISEIKLSLSAKESNLYSSLTGKLNSTIRSNVISKSVKINIDSKEAKDPLSGINTKLLNNKVNISNYFPKDYKPWESTRHFGLAVGEGALFNIFIPWALARYGRTWDSTSEERWPFIGFQSIWSNLQKGWNYDGDNFLTNLFSHPYGGNLFFNSGRSNGYNFWESSAFALGGSYLWETFMETNQPAINDWVNTGMNGAAFGEVLFRLSTLVTDNTARGSHRVWTEIAGGIINPVRLFTRLVTGEASRVFPNPEWRKPKDLMINLDAGVRSILEKDSVHNPGSKELDGIFELIVKYGDPNKTIHTTPFSQFLYNLTISSSSPVLTSMNIIGSLFSFELSKGEKSGHSLETTLNYNYINNPGFLYGGASIGQHLNSHYTIKDNLNLSTSLGLRFIPMGGTPNDYFYDSVDGRSYDFGQGLGAVASLSLIRSSGWEIFRIQYMMDYIWTQSQPEYSKHYLQGGMAAIQIPLRDYFLIGVSASYYKRISYYSYPAGYFGRNIPGQPETNSPDVRFETPVVRVFFKTRIL